MQLARTVEELRAWRRGAPPTLGFVPTMGALHEGHLDLVRFARSQNAAVVASVFVNPLQFGAGEDLARYPRDLEGDREKLAATGVDLLFAPDATEIYPEGFTTTIDVGSVAEGFEGALRPGHFRGVATVVGKLLHLVAPQRLYVGQKDAQQSAVLRRLVRDLAFDCTVSIVPTVRETDGLAMSSRNVYLDERERRAAPSLHRTLRRFVELLQAGRSVEVARTEASAVLEAPGKLDYLACVDAESFAPLATLRANAFAIAAAHFGRTRLLDNLWFPQ